MQKNAVTLIEALIVIIIIAILTAIGVPIYTHKIEHTRGERAIANIELIKDTLRIYYIKYEAEPTYPIISLSDINDNLSSGLTDSFFSYDISDQTTHRRIQAIRNSGIYNTNTVRYNINVASGSPDNWDSATSTWPWMP